MDNVGAIAWLAIANTPKKPNAWAWFFKSIVSETKVPALTKKKEKEHPWRNRKKMYE